jgi:hypothetical protein
MANDKSRVVNGREAKEGRGNVVDWPVQRSKTSRDRRKVECSGDERWTLTWKRQGPGEVHEEVVRVRARMGGEDAEA